MRDEGSTKTLMLFALPIGDRNLWRGDTIKRRLPGTEKGIDMIHTCLKLSLLLALAFAIGQRGTGSAAQGSADRLPVVQDEANQQKWREDLQAFVAGLKRHHPNPFHGISEAEFNAAVASLDASIATLTDSQITREFIGLAALISRNGRDGHTEYIPSLAQVHFLPLQLYRFSDGLFIVDARPAQAALIGQQVIGIGDTPIDEVIAALTPYIAKDNDATVRWHMPTLLVVPEFLESFGFITNPAQVPLRLQSLDGEQTMMMVAPLTLQEYVAWRELPTIKLRQTHAELYLSESYDPFWFRFLADTDTLYIRYNQIAARNDSGQKMAKFVKKLKKELRKKPVQRVVIDLRQNNGGDNTTYGSLLTMLKDTAAINQSGKLFAIINQGVFSAASNFVTDLERQTNVLLVGEPTGGSPNHYGDSMPVSLPNFGGTLFVSTVYHQRSDANDARLAIEPDIVVAFLAADYFAGRDAAMAAILDFTAPTQTVSQVVRMAQ